MFTTKIKPLFTYSYTSWTLFIYIFNNYYLGHLHVLLCIRFLVTIILSVLIEFCERILMKDTLLTFFCLSWFTISPPFCVSALTTIHSRSGSVMVGPNISSMGTTRCAIWGRTVSMNRTTDCILSGVVSINSGNVFSVKQHIYTVYTSTLYNIRRFLFVSLTLITLI